MHQLQRHIAQQCYAATQRYMYIGLSLIGEAASDADCLMPVYLPDCLTDCLAGWFTFRAESVPCRSR